MSITENESTPGFLEFIPDVNQELLRAIALQLANFYFKKNHSRSAWKREPKQRCSWEEPAKQPDGSTPYVRCDSPPLHLRDIARSLEGGTFDPAALGLPAPSCHWLDASIELSPHFHAMAFLAEPNLGSRFPIVPALEREGAIFTSFQTILLRRLAALREDLVLNSRNPGLEDWVQKLRTLVTECVSLIDNTLHQLYFKAQYDPLPGWTFNEKALGQRAATRVADKLSWVQQITRTELRAHDERREFQRLRELRNHLQHFDPPCFAFTFEQGAGWLNDALGVARLAWHIRRCASALPSLPLISAMLQRPCRFRPLHPERQRTKPPVWSGYPSCTWTLSSRPSQGNVAGVVVRSVPPIRII